MQDFKTPLSKAKGLGSAKDGVGHWWAQRMTALALLPLALWFCFSLASLPSMHYGAFTAWLAAPWNAILMLAVVVAGLYHGALGCQVIIEDYVSDTALRTAGIIAVKGLAALALIIGVFSVLKVAFGG